VLGQVGGIDHGALEIPEEAACDRDGARAVLADAEDGIGRFQLPHLGKAVVVQAT
jgi:hypothetical protein